MRRLILLTFTLCLSLVSVSSFAAPKSEYWPYWDQANPSNQATISHQPWQALLSRYVSQQGQHHLFDYANVTASDKQRLNTYLSQLAAIDPRQYNKAEQYAYWVNLYNALTVKVILDNYPIRSITKLGGWFTFGPWDQQLITINGKPLTLNDIEHRILRPIWQDPRTHYAVNCASLGCPNLQQQAFTAANTEPLLEQAASDFINSPKGVSLANGTLTLSSIYDWFSEDFGSEAQLFEHLGQYAPQYQVLQEKALQEKSTNERFQGKVRYDYDWALNQR